MIRRTLKNRPGRRMPPEATPAVPGMATLDVAAAGAGSTAVVVTFDQPMVVQVLPTAAAPSGITVTGTTPVRQVVGITSQSLTTFTLLLSGATATSVTVVVPQFDATFRTRFGGYVLPGSYVPDA